MSTVVSRTPMSSILNPVSDTVRTNLATLLFFQDSTRPTKLVNESKQKPREVTMLRVCQYYGLFVLSLGAALALSGLPEAYAQSKVSYEEAWVKCKAEVVAQHGAGEGNTAAKYARGGACMKQYGYRLKKSARF